MVRAHRSGVRVGFCRATKGVCRNYLVKLYERVRFINKDRTTHQPHSRAFIFTVCHPPFWRLFLARGGQKPRTDDKSNDHSLRLEGRSAPTRDTHPFFACAAESTPSIYPMLASFLRSMLSRYKYCSKLVCLHAVPLHICSLIRMGRATFACQPMSFRRPGALVTGAC